MTSDYQTVLPISDDFECGHAPYYMILILSSTAKHSSQICIFSYIQKFTLLSLLGSTLITYQLSIYEYIFKLEKPSAWLLLYHRRTALLLDHIIAFRYRSPIVKAEKQCEYSRSSPSSPSSHLSSTPLSSLLGLLDQIQIFLMLVLKKGVW